MGLPVKTGNIVEDPETLPVSPMQGGWMWGRGEADLAWKMGRVSVCALYRDDLGGNRKVVSLGSY